MVRISHNEIDIQEVIRSVTVPAAGGIDLFIGTTRDSTYGRAVLSLTYEAYEPMAVNIMARIEEDARSRWPLCGVTMVHRLGSVQPMEASVVIAVSAPHRPEAFDACRFLIDQLKHDVPIWKKEMFADGTTEWSGQHEIGESQEEEKA